MTRVRLSCSLVMLVLWIACSALAQEKVVPSAGPMFDTSVPDVIIIRLWQDKELAQPRWPEVAVIEMSSATMHNEFHRDPGAFFNKYKVFSKPVRPGQKDCLIAPEDKGSTAKSWSSVVYHTKDSGYS
jgi:hypothetical protein